MVYPSTILFFLATLSIPLQGQHTYLVESPSPSRRIKVEVTVSDSVYFSIRSNGTEILSRSTIALITRNSKLGIRSKVRNVRRRSVNETIINPVPFKRKEIPDRFNELTVSFREPFSVVFRAYDDGAAYRFVYRLGSPPARGDWSWIKPGISTEEWISGINLYGVDFKAGLNAETYKYYIDFASRFGIPYVMLDAGWSDYNDLLKITPGLDLLEVSAYARSKDVGLILWTLSMTLDRQLEEALTMFSSLGVKVIMTDFMDRDDQKILRFYQRIADATARHQIMVMFHGAFKNAGFERTYPHAITREGVLGSEWNIWSDKATPEHDLLIPFIRMVAGPMDYEPGFYLNANRRTFRPLPDLVMSQGTRCHQLAMFVAPGGGLVAKITKDDG